VLTWASFRLLIFSLGVVEFWLLLSQEEQLNRTPENGAVNRVFGYLEEIPIDIFLIIQCEDLHQQCTPKLYNFKDGRLFTTQVSQIWIWSVRWWVG